MTDVFAIGFILIFSTDFEETEDIPYIDSSITDNITIRDCDTVAELKIKLQKMAHEVHTLILMN